MDLLLASGYEDEDEDAQKSSLIHRKRRRVCIEQESTVSKELCVRSVPHIRGNWAGHVFVPISGSGEQGRFHSLARRTIQRFSHFLQEVVTEEKSSSKSSNDKDVTLVPHNECHLSLSRPFYLPLASIHSFRLELQTRLAQYATQTTCCCLTLGPEVVLLTNDEGTRTFLCLQASSSISSTLWVRRLISNVVNPILQDYGQKPYYETPHIHVSIASIPGQNLLTQYPHAFPQSNNGISVLKLPQQTNASSVDDTNNMSGSNSATSSDDDEEEDNSVTVQVSQIHCTFGTTKKFVMNLC